MPPTDPTPATEQDAMKTTEVSPILVTVVGSGKEVGVSGAVGVTREGQANLITQVVTPIMALAVRFGHRFIDALIGAEALKTLDTFGRLESDPGWRLQSRAHDRTGNGRLGVNP